MPQLCPMMHTMAYPQHLEYPPTFDKNHMQSSLHCTQTVIGTLQFEHSTAIRSTHDGLSSVELAGATHDIITTDFNIVTCVCQALPFHHLSNRDAPVTTHVLIGSFDQISGLVELQYFSSLASSQIECKVNWGLFGQRVTNLFACFVSRKRASPACALMVTQTDMHQLMNFGVTSGGSSIRTEAVIADMLRDTWRDDEPTSCWYAKTNPPHKCSLAMESHSHPGNQTLPSVANSSSLSPSFFLFASMSLCVLQDPRSP
ncbi:hypothetical protein J3E68DRAFT_49692 [Trichoderma sp. SZMC 28012]